MAVGTVSYMSNTPIVPIYDDTALGFTEGPTTVNITEEWVDQTTAQTGRYVLDRYAVRGMVTVTMQLKEVRNWDVLALLFPMGEKQIDTSTPPLTRFVGNRITDATSTGYTGDKATAHAKELKLSPVADYDGTPANETTFDFVIPLCIPSVDGAIPFDIETPEILEVTFTALFDPAATEGDYLWVRGLMTAVGGAWAAA